jgi:hypothetical protein
MYMRMCCSIMRIFFWILNDLLAPSRTLSSHMCAYFYGFLCTCPNTHNTCVFTHFTSHTHTHTHTHIYKYIHAQIHTHTYTCKNANLRIYMTGLPCYRTYIHTYIHTCMHAYIHNDLLAPPQRKGRHDATEHTYIHTYMHAYIHNDLLAPPQRKGRHDFEWTAVRQNKQVRI